MLGPCHHEGLTLLDIGMLAGQSLGHKLLADLCLGLFDSLFPLVTKCCAGAIYFALVMALMFTWRSNRVLFPWPFW